MTAMQQHDALERAFEAMRTRRLGLSHMEMLLDTSCRLARIVGLLQGWAGSVEPLPDRLVEQVCEALERE